MEAVLVILILVAIVCYAIASPLQQERRDQKAAGDIYEAPRNRGEDHRSHDDDAE